MTLPRLRLTAAALCALMMAAPPAARASGGYGPPRDELVSRDDADIDAEAILHGDLGILLPTWRPATLYLAWRAIVTDGKGPAVVHDDAPAADASTAVPAGWTDAASAPAGAGAPPDVFSVPPDSANCHHDAADFATQTLHAIQARADRTPARVDAWVAAQKRVFALCARDPLEVLALADPLLAPPPPLPDSEPVYWRQLREYQLAAAAFYGAHYADSQHAFEHIGKTPGHPMRAWGAYLALRSHLRAAQLPAAPPVQANADGALPPRPEQLADLETLRREGAAILRDPALAERHQDTEATLRRAAFLLAPAHRFAELSGMLDDLKRDPLADDTLGDWALMGYGTGDTPADAQATAALRAAHPWYDWIESVLRATRLPSRDASLPPPACADACRHATQAWTRGLSATGAAAPLHRAWLVAALMNEGPMPAAMEQEARAVAPAAPEYATVRYYLAARLLAGGRRDEARAMAQALVTRLRAPEPVSPSAVNLAIQLRFTTATSVADAAPWLFMNAGAVLNPDTGERAAPTKTDALPSSDGVRWMDRSLSVADLLALARTKDLPAPWRNGVAIAAWMRADLLGDAGSAVDASRLVEQFVPDLKPEMTRYRALPTPAGRQHWMVLSALRRVLSPEVVAWDKSAAGAWPVQKDDETTASMWCRITADDPDDWFPHPPAKTVPPLLLPEVSANPARRDAERARLLKVRTATGFVGVHAIEWAAAHPADKDLPWLLWVAIQSSRAGCVDADKTAISKKAWQVLHRRFPHDDWTDQAPYFY